MRFATDTGGTFTDLLIEDDDGRLSMFKAATVPAEPVRGVLQAFDVAARHWCLERRDLLARGSAFIHGTTHAINAIVTRRTARTALLVTRGHPDILVLREGGRLEPFNHAVRYPDPYIPRALTFEVRSGSSRPARCASRSTRRRSRRSPIGWWTADRGGRGLLAMVGAPPRTRVARGRDPGGAAPGVPVTLSHALNPSLREYRRAIATAMDASLKPLMNRYMAGLTTELRAAGFGGRILMLTSQGGMVDVDEVRGAPILAINSGPINGADRGRLDRAWRGGCSGMRSSSIPAARRSTSRWCVAAGCRSPTRPGWAGRSGDLTGFPSVDVKSIGAGGGSDCLGRCRGVLHVGPQSAGAVPGPACYGAGGTSATVTDAALVLGYIDASFFLGGRIQLVREAAVDAVRRDVAAPLAMLSNRRRPRCSACGPRTWSRRSPTSR